MLRVQSSLKARGGIWAIAQLMLLAAVLAAGPLWPNDWDGGFSIASGGVLLVLSGLLVLPGFLALGRNLTPHPKPRDGATLVRHGIYAIVRHPLYASLIFGSFGWSLVWKSGPTLGIALAFALFLDGKARVEERWLHERFPEYTDYARRVRRFVPWVY